MGVPFPQRRKKTKVMDPKEVKYLPGWVVLSLRLENSPLLDSLSSMLLHAAPVQGHGWQLRLRERQLCPRALDCSESEVQASNLFTVGHSDCSITGG